jgi:hypothetical protein
MFWGFLMFVIFLVCYLGQSISSGMEGKKGWTLQWACWSVTCATILVCYLVA